MAEFSEETKEQAEKYYTAHKDITEMLGDKTLEEWRKLPEEIQERWYRFVDSGIR